MRAPAREQTGGAGVSHVREKFQDINWGPVPNTEHDLGVDLFVQVRDDRRFDRAALVGVQVKTGNAKYFTRPEKNLDGKVVGWWYTDEDTDHFDDWTLHGLPHLLILVSDGPNRIAYWVHITVDKIVRTGKGCKILVPASQLINWENFDALMDAATVGKPIPDVQGSLYRAGPNSVPPGAALRHALLAPRLIAPRSYEGYDRTLTPEEATALVTGGRSDELERYGRTRVLVEGEVPPGKLNREMIEASATSKDWRWRLFHAVHAFALHREISPAVDLASKTMTTSDQPIERRAAAAVLAAVALVDAERWTAAAAVLAQAGEDLRPVDHAWVLTHSALVLVEQNKISKARAAAARALRTLHSDPGDVTARAISSAAATILLATADIAVLSSNEHTAMLDTAVSWWREMEIASALDACDDLSLETWSHSDDLGTELSDESSRRLTGAWLTALLAGNRAASTWPLSLRCRHEVQHWELEWRNAYYGEGADIKLSTTGTTPAALALRRVESALDALRRYGQTKDLEIVSERLWAAGPAEPIRNALETSISQPWRPSTARAHIALLAAGGDLLDTEIADTAVRQCLGALQDLHAFRRKARPRFLEWHHLPRALQSALIASSDEVHREVLQFTLAQMANADFDRAGDLAAVVVNLRPRVFGTDAARVRVAAIATEGSLAAVLLRHLKAIGDIDALEELKRRANESDLSAAGALGDVAELGKTATQAIINDCADACRRISADAANGIYSPAGDAARNLVVLNLAHTEAAVWDPLLDLLFDPRVFSIAKISAVEILTRANNIPDAVVGRLRTQLVQSGSQAFDSLIGFGPVDDLRAKAYALSVAVGAVDSAKAVPWVLSHLRGSTSQRRGASEVINALGRNAESPLIQGALVMLTGDPQHWIRSAAVTALVRGSSPGAHHDVEQALLAAAGEAGCLVPQRLAHALTETPGAWIGRDELRDRLASHISAYVRIGVVEIRS